jgi:hypothetical protein
MVTVVDFGAGEEVLGHSVLHQDLRALKLAFA